MWNRTEANSGPGKLWPARRAEQVTTAFLFGLIKEISGRRLSGKRLGAGLT